MAAWFLAPLFLAGLLLVGVPYLIHKIRRPERKEVRFSSLMFVPDLKIETIERRRIEHILLMLLRMLLVLMLVFAFSRPYLERASAEVFETPLPAGHIILLDQSYSMGQEDVFEAARAKVNAILDQIPDDVPVGLVGFAQSPVTLSPLIDADGRPGSAQAAREALAKAQVTNQTTRYAPAMQFAENRLLDAVGDDVDRPYTLHLVSDFQAAGLPKTDPDWTLSGQIAFEGHPVGQEQTDNLAVADLAVKTHVDAETLITAKIKNWSPVERGLTARLILDQDTVETKALTIPAGGAAPVHFRVQGEARTLWGRVEIDPDDLDLDNRRYFSIRPPEKIRLTLLGDGDSPGSGSWFLRRALASIYGPDTLNTLDQNALAALPSEDDITADVLIVADLAEFQPQTGARLKAFLNKGGRILLITGPDLDTPSINRNLLNDLGWEVQGPAYAQTVAGRFDTWTGMDFQHPLFKPFQGAKFNDFSRIRFHNHHRLAPLSNTPAVVPVRFSGPETPGTPAFLELEHGPGRLLIWSFSPTPAWTNLPKSVKFPPVLAESVNHLRGYRPDQTAYLVGEGAAPPSATEVGTWLMTTPQGEEWTLAPDQNRPARRPEAPGLITFAEQGGRERRLVEAVNIDAAESSSERISLQEFATRFTTAQGDAAAPSVATAERPQAGDRRIEFGRLLLIVAILLILAETIYATRLSQKRNQPNPTTPT